MYVRHRLDLSWGDLFFGAGACLGAWRRRRLGRRVLRVCGVEGDGMVCFSVRTGWDLWLRALGLGEGDEVMVSAVTHPDMARVARAHGVRVVPADVDPLTLAPRVAHLEAAFSGRTRAVVVAHLFGGRVELGPVARFARERGLLLVEDCAQAFVGPEKMGDPRADVSLYSFGALKTATAIGGAVVRVKDGRVLARMRGLEAGYPGQGRRDHALRSLKASMMLCAGGPLAYAALMRACGWWGVDIGGLLGPAARSFPQVPAEELLRRIRRRPSAPLLASLARRLEGFDAGALAARTAAGQRLSRALDPSILQPGSRSVRPTYWLFPVVVRRPGDLVRGLRALGFDASRATSSIAALPPPEGAPRAEAAERMMGGIVFLPAYPSLPVGALDRLAAAVNGLAVSTGQVEAA